MNDFYENKNSQELYDHYRSNGGADWLDPKFFSDKPKWRTYVLEQSFHAVFQLPQAPESLGCRFRLSPLPEVKNSVIVKKVEVISSKGNDVIFNGSKKLNEPIEFGTRTHKQLRKMCDKDDYLTVKLTTSEKNIIYKFKRTKPPIFANY
jgi:hypothetical protein